MLGWAHGACDIAIGCGHDAPLGVLVRLLGLTDSAPLVNELGSDNYMADATGMSPVNNEPSDNVVHLSSDRCANASVSALLLALTDGVDAATHHCGGACDLVGDPLAGNLALVDFTTRKSAGL